MSLGLIGGLNPVRMAVVCTNARVSGRGVFCNVVSHAFYKIIMTGDGCLFLGHVFYVDCDCKKGEVKVFGKQQLVF